MHLFSSTGSGRSLRATLLFALTLAGFATATSAQTIRTIAGGWTGDSGPAVTAALHAPHKVTVDAQGNLYVADEHGNRIRKIAPTGVITTVAGSGVNGFGGDGGQAIAAKLSSPTGVAVDAAGNLFIADRGNNRVRKVSAAGVISTLAGDGSSAFGGDGGPATSAKINFPFGVAVDAAGNVFITDGGNFRVRKVTPGGVISTVAGSGVQGFNGLSGNATGMAINIPVDLALDGAGNLYFTDVGNALIRKVTPDGQMSTVAGNRLYGFAGDGGNAVDARLAAPGGIAVDAAGAIYIADSDNNRVRRVSASGTITTIAGNGNANGGGDGGAATAAGLSSPRGLGLDAAGNVYVADIGNARVRKVTPAGAISSVAGNGTYGYNGDGKSALQASLGLPTGMALDASGNLYFGDYGSQRVRKVTPLGVISTVAGNGQVVASPDGGQATAVGLADPAGMAIDAAGNIYFADRASNRIRRIAANGVLSTVAGTGTYGFGGDGGPATQAMLANPFGIALDRQGNLYIADSDNNRVRRVASNGTISTVAGNGNQAFGGDGGAATSASLSFPSGVAVDAAGNLYIADMFHNRVRRVAVNGVITTAAGNGNYEYTGDGGAATSASLRYPVAVGFDGAGNLYIADSLNHSVRKVTPNGVITTVAGNGTAGLGAEGAPPVGSTLSSPSGILVDAAGDVYVADSGNRRVRKLVFSSQPRTSVEFYNATMKHYFITAEPAEQAIVDGGGAGPGWTRTGDSFKVYAADGAPSGSSQVCRFFGSVTPGPNSHFYTAAQAECDFVKALDIATPAGQPKWHYEGLVFASYAPVNGQCPAEAPVAVYRAYNNRAAQLDSNHRITTRQSEIPLLVAQGWVSEGIVMCGLQ
jgi:trimeric autotransporter adhesin